MASQQESTETHSDENSCTRLLSFARRTMSRNRVSLRHLRSDMPNVSIDVLTFALDGSKVAALVRSRPPLFTRLHRSNGLNCWKQNCCCWCWKPWCASCAP